MLRQNIIYAALLLSLGACSNISHVQRDSPAEPYKDYRGNNAVVGVGEPISKRQMRANALFNASGSQNLEDVMYKVASTYNVAIRWGNGVRRDMRQKVLISDLTFSEARAYLEDVYDVQIIREGDRRLLVLPSANEARVESFSPGRNVSLSEAVRGLAKQCGYNIVISENQDRLRDTRITTTLKDVSCYDAFGALLHPHGLSLRDKGDYYAVAGLPTRQWTLNLYEPNSDSEKSVEYTSTFAGDNEDTGSQQTLGGNTRVITTNQRRLWVELERDLQELLDSACTAITGNTEGSVSDGGDSSSSLLPPPSSEGGESESSSEDNFAANTEAGTGQGSGACGYVRINNSVGLVQMQAPSEVLDDADEIVRHVEDVASRRIMLEARVLAVKRDRSFDRGGNFGFQDTNTGDSQFSLFDNLGFTSVTAAVQEALSQNQDNPGGLNLGVGGNLEAAVRVVERFGTTYNLMQPMLELMDRQQATLVDGSSQPFIVRTVETESTETGNLTNINTDLRYQFFGLQFAATAQIADDGEPHTVSVQIPILSKIGEFSVPIFEGSEQIGTDQIPIPETRLIDQKVRLQDGEIKVIGGLTKTIAIDREAGVPLLRDVSRLGDLAEQEGITYENVEFVVLLQAQRLY